MLYGERKSGLNDRIELVYYDGEKYVRYLDEIFEKISSYSLEDSFVCKMRIINCAQESIVSEIIKFGEKLYENDAYMDIEHLISLSTENKDRKSTRLNSSHANIACGVFFEKKK